MAQKGGNEAEAVENSAMQLGRWLSEKLDARGMKPIDLWRLMQQHPPRNGKAPSRAPVFSWAAGTTSATADNVIYIARLLDTDPVEPLELAGHTEVAGLVRAAAEAGKPARQPLDTESNEEFIARLRASKDPEMREIATVFEHDLARARRMATIEAAEVMRRSARAGHDAP
jgi:hypothetical protein